MYNLTDVTDIVLITSFLVIISSWIAFMALIIIVKMVIFESETRR